jgi:hypothetical protein
MIDTNIASNVDFKIKKDDQAKVVSSLMNHLQEFELAYNLAPKLAKKDIEKLLDIIKSVFAEHLEEQPALLIS